MRPPKPASPCWSAGSRPDYQPLFSLLDYRGMVSRHGDRHLAEATIKLNVRGHEVHTAAEGNGSGQRLRHGAPQGAAAAVRQVAQIQLTDYKVRITNSNTGTRAITRVLIDWHDGDTRRWSTVGAG